jgi:hypothetical protein
VTIAFDGSRDTARSATPTTIRSRAPRSSAETAASGFGGSEIGVDGLLDIMCLDPVGSA